MNPGEELKSLKSVLGSFDEKSAGVVFCIEYTMDEIA